MKADAQKAILAATGRYIRKLLDPVEARLKILESVTIQKGDPGKDGSDGKDGRDGVDGQSPSADAVADAVASRFERRFADLSISWERQARDMAEKAIDRMPVAKDGVDGKDGRSVEQPTFEYDGRRSFTIKTVIDGETVAETFRLPVVMDAGFYAEGKDYEQGDAVTFGGSAWVAQCDTKTKPDIGNPEWRLMVKKGRDGSRS